MTFVRAAVAVVAIGLLAGCDQAAGWQLDGEPVKAWPRADPLVGCD